MPLGTRLLRRIHFEKKGLVIQPDMKSIWRKVFAGMACVLEHRGGYRAFMAGRTTPDAPHTIGWVDLNHRLEIDGESPKPILEPRPGTFDSGGVLAPCVVRLDYRRLFMYYVGSAPSVPSAPLVLQMNAGLAASEDNGLTWHRVIDGPLIPKDDQDPGGVGTVFVMCDAPDRWRMWYTSIEAPVERNGVQFTPRYFIKQAESSDGIHWKRWANNTAVDVDGRSTTARPMILHEPEGYRMWYSFKQAFEPSPGDFLPQTQKKYRVCSAESLYGRGWCDQGQTLDVSGEGWDSEMVEYAWVVPRGDEYLMFYSGNSYGATGTGVAIGRLEVEPTGI